MVTYIFDSSRVLQAVEIVRFVEERKSTFAHVRREAASQIPTARDGREIIHVLERITCLKRLHRSEASRGGTNTASGQGEASCPASRWPRFFFRKRGQAGVQTALVYRFYLCCELLF